MWVDLQYTQAQSPGIYRWKNLHCAEAEFLTKFATTFHEMLYLWFCLARATSC